MEMKPPGETLFAGELSETLPSAATFSTAACLQPLELTAKIPGTARPAPVVNWYGSLCPAAVDTMIAAILVPDVGPGN
jgi:hypothetical protein